MRSTAGLRYVFQQSGLHLQDSVLPLKAGASGRPAGVRPSQKNRHGWRTSEAVWEEQEPKGAVRGRKASVLQSWQDSVSQDLGLRNSVELEMGAGRRGVQRAS